MDQREINLIFALLRAAVCGQQPASANRENCNEQTLQQIYGFTQKHNIAHLIGAGLQTSGLAQYAGAAYMPYLQQQCAAISRYEKANYELIKICNVFEKAEIKHMPLKGSVLSKYYPEPWLRVGCDIDILVPEVYVDRAAELLCTTCGYSYNVKGSHDICLLSPNGQHVELHYDLIEDSCSTSAAQVLRRVWDASKLEAGTSYRYVMCDAMQYFYHIAHMAKHFMNGGCGIKPFVDLWVFDMLPDIDQSARLQLLEEGKLDQFSKTVLEMSKLWRDCRPLDEDQLLLQSFIFSGGAYGTLENKVNIQMKNGNKRHYLLKRLILPYDEIKFHYPILQKHKYLMPVMQVVRWLRYFDADSRKRANMEMNYSRKHSEDSDMRMQSLRMLLGLDNNEK